MTDRELMQQALDAMLNFPNDISDEMFESIRVLRARLAQPEQEPKYRRGDRLLCLETEEYCVIHVAGANRQWVKFPDSHVGVYTNEQVAEMFELLPKEREWQWLTDEEANELTYASIAEIEAKLKEKNG